jgi:hypothetical protein
VTTHESNAAPSRRAARRGDEQDARVVTMLQELAPQLDVEPDTEYQRAARQRLVAMAAVRTPEPVRPTALRRLLAGRAVDAPAGRWRTRATAGLAGAALTVTSLATLVALAAGAGPGDVLYGVKRGTEQTQLALAGDSRGQTLLDLARTRLEELDDLDGDTGLITSTLATMDDQTTEGATWYLARALDTSDTAPLDTVSRWAGEQSAQLATVGAGLPADSTDDVAASLVLLGSITQRADGWRSALACPQAPGPAPAAPDRLGPVPGACVAAVETPTSPVPGTPIPGAPVPGTPVPGAPVPGAPVPGDPAPGGTPPQAGLSTTPGEPGSPALPTGAPPAPQVPQVPGLPTLPTAPPLELDLPGGLLPNLPLPSLTLPSLPARSTAPASPSATPSPSKPAVTVPVPAVPCVDLPPLVRLGEC